MSVYVNNGAMGAVEHSGTAASAIALSAPVAAGALLLKLENVLGIGVSLLLLLTVALAFIGGAALARWRPLQNGRALITLRYGFLLAAAGWLLTLLMLFGGQGWPALLPGIALGGLGLGVAYRTAAGAMGALGAVSGLTMLASIVAAVAAALLIQTYAAPGVGGFCFAFALLADLALLGALIVRVAEREEGD
ncbi:hypothetical protein [Serratia entomophila]|uniref:hypothetical protein n=1 Tax=Serratia entomophila TaxID=42906 RepID=UPI002177EA29|nr:hypothetical protein [Serratia entomophila]CAI0774318.1 Uncharacterised protein [Serratia entomophila]CAI1500597.1 Uncharacterised protein [Serratia entomophila]CAI1508846.1 Uncharacterised protein [Serratia entomophila]CAI1509321.1 Uncharacterised protein [Serratia entomophila]CAI1612195.1 Uncharacterised protein [Serratia entomophila]